MKEYEVKLISELMKNSRRSDRELSKVIGTSQPTITRLRSRLEREGVIKEYTMMPDFVKLNYRLLGLTFIRLKRTLTSEQLQKAKEVAAKQLAQSGFGIVMLEQGLGLGYDGVIMAYYKNFTEYSNHKKLLKEAYYLEGSEMDSFLVNLEDEVHYRSLSLRTIANLMVKSLDKP